VSGAVPDSVLLRPIEQLDPGEGLIGRASELALISSLLAAPGSGAPGLLLRGASGAGKTALLDVAAQAGRQAGLRVLRAWGVESEAELAFSGLHQLLHPLREHTAQLPVAQREALERAFGLAEGPSPSRFVLSAAALALVDAAAARGPVLLLVDDGQWIDRYSAEVLGFVARRLSSQPAVLLAAVTTGGDGGTSPSMAGRLDAIGQAGLPELEVLPLPPAAAARLLTVRYPALGPMALRRLLDEADGNPLALVELPAALSERQLSGRDPLPERLPLSRRLETVFAGRLQDLPETVRRLLLLAALEGSGDLQIVRRAARSGWSLEAVIVAERANLVRVDPEAQYLTFRHPLVRAAVEQASTVTERRSAHRSLALALRHDPERRAWHLAGAAERPDETVATALEDAGHRALRRGGGIVGVAAPARAAELTAQERQIAGLAAEGLTNKQIGERLFLSHRTVGTHLYKVFPKLGISSRAALRDALEVSGKDHPACH